MVDKQENTKRLAKNTILLTLRSVFNLFCSLYSSRLILQALGVEDYGIYNAVGGFVSMFWLVTGSLSTAIGRFITVELGRGDKEQLKKVFSMSLNIMLCFGIVVLLFVCTMPFNPQLDWAHAFLLLACAVRCLAVALPKLKKGN